MTHNAFKKGTSEELLELISSVIIHPNDAGEDNVWIGRCLEFLEAFVPAMVWKREKQDLLLDSDSFYNQAKFENVINLSNALLIPEDIKRNVNSYLVSLSGYTEIEKFDEFDQHFLMAKQQHGYRTMCLFKPLECFN